MAQVKIKYGIDLGTTNSAICRMENGVPVVKKVEVTDETMPSCVYFNKKRSELVGKGAYNTMKSDKRRATQSMHAGGSNTYVEFKRTMGTDKRYDSSNMGRSYSSEELSALVLKALKSYIQDEDVDSVIITVPAKFTVNQKTATLEAAKLAGFSHTELLQEPIAAAMAYGLQSADKNGFWLVFDFGGGTFDAALMKVEEGIIEVVDTEGDNYLGGKNLDYALVDELILPELQKNYALDGFLADADKRAVLRDALKTYAEDLKNHLSFKEKDDILSNLGELGCDEQGEEMELDMTVTQAAAYQVMRPLFQKAVDICKTLIGRNNLTGTQIAKLILVGGPTHSPLIRQMLREQICDSVDTSIDPMTAVAIGAAIYASTRDVAIDLKKVTRDEVVLDLGYDAQTVETTIYATVGVEKGPSEVEVRLTRGDGTWDSGWHKVNEKGDVVELSLVEGRANAFRVECRDLGGHLLRCTPAEFNVMQGVKVGNATLPYDISLGVQDTEKDKAVVVHIKGLERNHQMPATGTCNGLHVNSALRPGDSSAERGIRIPIYQADEGSNGKSVVLYEYIGDVRILGTDVETPIPEGSQIDITLKVDSNEQMSLQAYFPKQDVTVEKSMDTSKKQSLEEARQFVGANIPEARRSLQRLKGEGCDVTGLAADLDAVQTEHNNNQEPKLVLDHLRILMRKIEELEGGTAWQRLEKELRKSCADLETANKDLGDAKTTQIVEQLKLQMEQVIAKQDEPMGKQLKKQMMDLYMQLTMVYQLAGFIVNLNQHFGQTAWKNAAQARQLVNQGMASISAGPTVEGLHPIVMALFALMPDNERNRHALSGLSM